MMSIQRNYAHRTKSVQKPFTFHWEIEKLPECLGTVGSSLTSPSFEVAVGVLMYVKLYRAKVNDEEWLGAFLTINPKSAVKETTLNFSIALLRSPPMQDLRLDFGEMTRFTAYKSYFVEKKVSCGFNKFVRFADLVSPDEGFLADGHLLTVFVQGTVSGGVRPDEKEIVLKPEENLLELEETICKQNSENFKKMFEEGLHTDFVLKAKDANGELKELKVHKCVLATESEVFAAMLSKPELKECREGALAIEDISFEVLETFVRFLYSGRLPPKTVCRFGVAAALNWLFLSGSKESEVELGLLIAADKYRVIGLKTLVEHRLAASLSFENACVLFANADRHKAPFLRARSIEFIHQNLMGVVKTEGWRQLCTRLGTPEYAHLSADLFSDVYENEEVGTTDDDNNI